MPRCEWRNFGHDLNLKNACYQIVRWKSGSAAVPQTDELAAEEPLEIQVDTRPVCVTMRTPGHDEELACGFLISEGIIQKRRDLARIQPYPRNQQGNVVNVFLSPGLSVNFAQLTRHVFASSSCGLCGKATIEAVHAHFKPVTAKLSMSERSCWVCRTGCENRK